MESVMESNRVGGMEEFHVMRVMALAEQLEKEGVDIIRMEVGEPDFRAPDAVKNAAISAIEGGATGYTSALGLPELREKISEYYVKRYNYKVDNNRIAVTPGASGALLLALAATVDVGDGVLVTDPGYPCNRNIVRSLGAKDIPVAVTATENYQLSAGLLEKYLTADVRAAIVSTPSNPTGTVISAEELLRVYERLSVNSSILIVDEIYHGLTYEDDMETALNISDDIFVVNSFSKYFSMTGWRLGWLVVPSKMVNVVERLSQNLIIAPSTIAQYAAIACFEEEQIEIYDHRRDIFKERRDFLVKALTEIGFKIEVVPEGAFYIYADCSLFTNDSYQFCFDLIKHTGVAITPGKDFGYNNSHKYVRFAYANSMKNLRVGVSRMKEYLL